MTSDEQLRAQILEKIRKMPESMAKEKVPGMPTVVKGKHFKGMVSGIGLDWKTFGEMVLNRKKGFRRLMRQAEVLGLIT